MKNAITLCLAGMLFICSCSSTTVIMSEPPGATVYMDGEKKGTTPYTYTDTKVVGSETPMILRLEGYEDKSIVLKRDEKADVGAIVGGIFLLIPFLWTMEYNPEHNYELTPERTVDHDPQFRGNTNTTTESGSNDSTTELIKLKALLDENAITEDDFTTLKVKILNEEYDYTRSAAEEIRKLKKLKDDGLLTESEYNSQKNKVVNR